MRSTEAMRARARQLANRGPGHDDYDRAVLCIIDDLEDLMAKVDKLLFNLDVYFNGKKSNDYNSTDC